MNTLALSQIEESIDQLSLDEQLWLMAWLAQQIRSRFGSQIDFEAELTVMATDPEIRHELDIIEKEFMITEGDGLDLK